MSIWTKYTHSLIINDDVFQLDQINSILKKNQLPSWQRSIYQFIQDWINKDNYLSVKTSGSTGKPKVIKIHKNVFVFSALNTENQLRIKKGAKAFLCLPGSYIAGKMMIVRAFVSGLNLFWQKPSSYPDITQKFDFAAMTPMQIQNILNQNKYVLNNIDKLIVGGAPVNDYILKNTIDLNTKIYESYGMTETVSHIALKQLTGKAKSDYFTVLPGISINKDERDCLTITSDKLQVQNLKTNDIVHIIDSKKFKWLGRIDNIINSGGIKLIPEQIEEKLRPFIKSEFIIFGLSDDLLTNIPAILIEDKAKINLDIFNKVLTKYELPKKVYYIKKFVRTESGKIKRKETVSLASSNIYPHSSPGKRFI